MTLKSGFLKTESNSIQIPRKRIILGIVLALISIFVIYSFLYLFREFFRYMSITDDFDMWMLSDKEVKFYNLFYAFLAVIFSQSFFINFIFNIPKRPFAKKNWRKTTILNDQRVLNLSFVNWFAKLTFMFGIMFGFGFRKGYYAFSFYPTYIYFFILLVIVLFMQSFVTIRLIFGKKSLKWLLYSFIIVTVISFGLSNLNVVNYRSINESISSKCVFTKYNLELPETNVYRREIRRSLIQNIYIVASKEENKSDNPIIVIENREIPFNEIGQEIIHIREIYDEHERPLINFMLHIHGEIKMEFIYKLKSELSKYDIWRISYAVVPKNRIYDKRFYQELSFAYRIIPIRDFFGDNRLIEMKNFAMSRENIIEINRDSLNKIYVNGNFTSYTNLKAELKTLVKKNNDYTFKVYVHESDSFSSYLQVISTCREVIQELRNEYSLNHYSCEFENLNEEESDSVRDIYPEIIFELNKETMTLLNMK